MLRKIRDLIWASTEKKVESGRVLENGGIRASTGEGFRQVQKKFRVSIEEGSGRVPEKVPGKYRRRVRASTEKGSR